MAIGSVTLGFITLVIQIVILFLLLLGVRFARSIKKKFVRHGQLSTIALILHTFLILFVMIPTFLALYPLFGDLPLWMITVILLHAATGGTAEILGAVLVLSWRFLPLAKAGCLKRKRVMMPTFLIWAFSLILGAVIRITILGI